MEEERYGEKCCKSKIFIFCSKKLIDNRKSGEKNGHVSASISFSYMKVNIRINGLKCWKWLALGSGITD